ncbi:MAG: T9SS type A sorting domain-containing protein [Ignavibacteriales bacterium]|nr:T9SS type A sorting domain-containing protein [Ignavibacteriales bacterium]
MSKNLFYTLAMLMIGITVVFAGSKSLKYAGKAPRVIDAERANSVVFNVPAHQLNATFSYTTVDTMANAYGPGNVYVNPISYDPYSNSLVIIHRSKSSYASGGSGGVFYAFSKDGGATWTKRIGPLSAGLAGNTNGRYPSIALHNPTKAASADSVLVQYVFPLLVGGGFGGMIYGTDPGVGANSPLATIDSAGVPWSSSMASPTVLGAAEYVFAAPNYSDDGHISIFRAADGVTFTGSNPAQLGTAKLHNGLIDDVAGIVYQGGNYYVGVRAQFAAAPTSDTGSYTLGISKSTDKGVTWSEYEIVPWKALVPANYAYNIFANDFTVDGAGGYHWLTVGVDTTANPDLWSLYHLYKASGGSWTATKIKDLPTHENWGYGDLPQTLTENQLSVSKNGQIVAAKWIEDSRGATYSDSLPIADVWTSTWKAGSGWSTPSNRTSTPTINDQITHIAPIMGDDGKAHLMRNQSVTTSGNVAGMDVHVTKVDYSNDVITGVRKDDGVVVGTFELSQNYPNPFNPSTTISFTLPKGAQTTLKVYNMIGQEVATLINEYQNAGLYFVDFDASKLASGIYLYKLQSGSFVETKKMLLVK